MDPTSFTKANGATLVTTSKGVMTESAYSFDGKNDYLFTDLDIFLHSVITVILSGLWAKANDVEQSRYLTPIINIQSINTPDDGATCQIHTIAGGRYPTSNELKQSNEEIAALPW